MNSFAKSVNIDDGDVNHFVVITFFLTKFQKSLHMLFKASICCHLGKTSMSDTKVDYFMVNA